ncbi:MAG: tetratricopeptide repeat protein [Pseudomonadota bacterium]|nr:MAG: tetratricopeptide repeat protein [Pseudomonadota bacterium]
MTQRRPRKAVGPRLKILLVVVLALFALLLVNSLYLAGVTLVEHLTGATYQDYAYQLMFLFHLAVGLLLVVPALVFIGLHMRNTWRRPNRRAVYAGLGLFAAVLLLLVSGILLVRFDFFQIRNETFRNVAYWLHVIVPLACIWLFVLHRLAGPRIRWKSGLAVAAVGGVFALGLVALQAQDPRQWNRPGQYGKADFLPALTRSATGDYIPAETLMMDGYCAECHADVHAQWENSMHRWASFNNPVYLMSVRNTREFALERDGNVEAARFCAACHDLVPLLSGAFDDPGYDDVNHPTAHAGITCTSCHAITHVNSPRGNGDFTVEEPVHYPFAFSDDPMLEWVNAQLIKAKPAFHKKTFLKPLHKTPEFCGTCHKVHLPEHLNAYKWLRGQNHYDSFRLSGVSGHGVTSFYYPERARENCASCHMPTVASDDFGARLRGGEAAYTVRDHLFPAANTAIAKMVGLPEDVIDRHQAYLHNALRIDIAALREAGRIDGPLIAPIRPEVPALQPGRDYLIETVVRTTGVGHHFTQGTADSNQVWVEVEVEHDGRIVGRSGGMEGEEHRVDPWSHFINVYMLDREGNRIERRNPEDIFVPLYNHQIPPGAADLLHYRLEVPEGVNGELTVRARVHYRKFDVALMKHVEDPPFVRNDLPITTLATDEVTFPVGEASRSVIVAERGIPQWQRLNDYGIGALRKPQRRQLRQAEDAFARVEALGHSSGALNLARVYLEEGRLDEAAAALRRAATHEGPPPAWSMAWFSGLLLFQEGRFEAALEAFEALVETRFNEARERGFDFARDDRLLNRIGLTWRELANARRGEARTAALRTAHDWFDRALVQDPENVTAHYNLWQVEIALGNAEDAAWHSSEYQRYRVDDNARDRAVAAARRRDPAADHAAEPVVIYDLHREGAEAYDLSVPEVIERISSPVSMVRRP